MVYVNDILEFMVDKDKSAKFEVSRLIVDREFANDLKMIFVQLKQR